jgi:predicted ATPase
MDTGWSKSFTSLRQANVSLAEGHFPDGVAFVALAPLRDPALVVSTIARSLGLREEQGQSTADTLHAFLREKRLLLVLDNFEHLLEAVGAIEEPEEVLGLLGALVDRAVGLTTIGEARARERQPARSHGLGAGVGGG